MSEKKPRPEGLRAFDALVGKLAQVPKRELQEKIDQRAARKKKQR